MMARRRVWASSRLRGTKSRSIRHESLRIGTQPTELLSQLPGFAGHVLVGESLGLEALEELEPTFGRPELRPGAFMLLGSQEGAEALGELGELHGAPRGGGPALELECELVELAVAHGRYAPEALEGRAPKSAPRASFDCGSECAKPLVVVACDDEVV